MMPTRNSVAVHSLLTGVLIGGRLSLSVPDPLLRIALATVLGLSGLKLIDVPGSGIAIICVLGIGMAALLVYIGRHSLVWNARRTASVADPPVGTEPA